MNLVLIGTKIWEVSDARAYAAHGVRNDRKFANRNRPRPQNQGLFLQQTCAACAAVSLYLLRMFLHNWKAYHFPVYQDIARKSFCPRMHLHLRFVNLGPVRSVWPTKKSVHGREIWGAD